ncbi:uncharacterized protein QC763_0111040 [Podospora pseudopauciseta]|uniref:Uncharacterized protein n=1 Tax=Podospora pseudopauciseta TaxID=2093780 RepID=A0ABR0H2W4_9PEZI|nr:hypothetical protein QC763_0111040 [Podospora pseudopauciseta]
MAANITPGTLGGTAPISYPHSGSLGNPPVVSVVQAANSNPGTMMPSLHVHEPANVSPERTLYGSGTL